MCLPGGEVTDPQVAPGGGSVSAVLSEPDGERTRNRLVMWDVSTATMTEVLVTPEPTAGRGLSGGVHD